MCLYGKKEPKRPSSTSITAKCQSCPAAVTPPLGVMRLGGYDFGKPGYPGAKYSGSGNLHNGVDLKAAKEAPVFAPEDGEVIESGWNEYGGGYQVKFRGKSGCEYIFAHLNKEDLPKVGQLTQGAHLASVGPRYPGEMSDGPHLHLSVRKEPYRPADLVDPNELFQIKK